MGINYREVKRRFELDGGEATVRHFSEALQEKHLTPDDFSIRGLAEALIPEGSAWVNTLDPRNGSVSVHEAYDGVDSTAFQAVTGHVIQTRVLDSYEHEAFVASKLVRTIPTRLDGEKLPTIGQVHDDITEVGPGMPYPNLGFSESYVETPPTEKRGFIVPVTREAIFFDRSNLILNRASEVGEVLGLNKEKRILDTVLGINNPYKFNGQSTDTYLLSGEWANQLPGNELVDWSNVDAAEQLMADILDPNTGEPVLLRATNVLVMPAYRHNAHRIFNASEITYTTPGGDSQTTSANPLGSYTVNESRIAYRRLLAAGVQFQAAQKQWFLGDFQKAFAYMENWPITVTQAPLGGEAEFSNDIVLRFKASERGAAAVLDPRYVVKCTA
ncbi:MAG: hypothetical protein AAGA92_12100 [Planctomycetota bacterium]